MRQPSKPLPIPEAPPTDRQIAAFIAESCAELRRLARKPAFRTVNYLLDMARLEAERLGREMPD